MVLDQCPVITSVVLLCKIAFVKLFDNIVMCQYHDQLCSSELQFGFKRKSSTHMCTMVLKETMSYYVHNSSPVCCVFLDATKAFDRVNYVKLFRRPILVEQGPYRLTVLEC